MLYELPADVCSATTASAAATPTEQVAVALAAARADFDWWRTQDLAARLAVLRDFKRRLVQHVDELTEIIHVEVGKPRFDAINEVFQCCNQIAWLLKHSRRVLQPQSVWSWLLPHKRSRIERPPFGVVGVITPWNYPAVLVTTPIVQALAAGNLVVCKPSEHASATAQRLIELLLASTDRPVVRLLPGGKEMGLALAASAVDKLFFTGSTATGRQVAQTAATHLTPTVLELGGSDAMLVAADADLERAGAAAVWGAFLNAGQSCIGIEHAWVDPSVMEAFSQRVAALADQLTLGTPATALGSTDYDVGPIRTIEQFDRLVELRSTLVRAGGTILTQRSAVDRERRLFPPTVIRWDAEVPSVTDVEIFGPILLLQSAPSWDDVLDHLNASAYGMSVSIWTRDRGAAAAWTERLQVGAVAINDALLNFALPGLPFGGRRASGHGRTQGADGLLEFTASKTVTRHLFGPRREIHWFPYGQRAATMKRLLRWLHWS